MEDVFHKIGAYDEAKSGYGARPNNEETVEITCEHSGTYFTVISDGEPYRRLGKIFRYC